MSAAAGDLSLLEAAARAAGEIARRFWRQAPRVWDKGEEGPVTEADLAVNAALQAMLLEARPGYGWLSEETPDAPARLDARRCFILDPIDGTRAFIDGQADFSHSLAVAEDGRIVAAVVYLPVRDALFAASEGAPATLNGAPIRVSAAQLDGASVLTARTNLAPEHWRGPVPPLRREFRPSVAARLCYVAEGRFDAALSLRAAWEWDIAAGALIVQQAGGLCTDRRGLPLRFNRASPRTDGLIAAGPALHGAILARLA